MDVGAGERLLGLRPIEVDQFLEFPPAFTQWDIRPRRSEDENSCPDANVKEADNGEVKILRCEDHGRDDSGDWHSGREIS